MFSESDVMSVFGANAATPVAQAMVAVTGSVQQITLPFAGAQPGGTLMRLVNEGTQLVSWCFGANANLTVNNGVPMLPNSDRLFAVPPNVTQISVVAAAVGSNARVTCGTGV